MTIPYRVLARKYRPIALSDLVGQDLLVQTLTQAIQHNRLPHAFLFHGIRGVGKTTTARIMARVLNCLNNSTGTGKLIDACGYCTSCISLTEDRHLDVIEIDAASRTGVDDVREIIDSSRYKAVTGHYKIFIVDEVHMLSKSAFNALLKTLEEPPPHVKFIFATTEIRKIPDTILSRCMRFDLKRIELRLLVDYLKKIAGLEGFTVEDEAVFSLARAADGSMRDGLSLLDQAIALSHAEPQTDHQESIQITAQTVFNMLGLANRQRLFALLKAVFEGKTDLTLQYIRDLLHDGADAQLLLQDILDMLYGLICLKAAPQFQQEGFWSQTDKEAGLQLINLLASSVLLSLWQALLNAFQEVKVAPTPSQALELALLRACYLADLPSLENLVQSFKGTPLRSVPSSHAMQQLVTNVSPQPSLVVNKSVTKLPTSFASLVECISVAREPILYSQMLQDVDCINYQPGEMTLYLKPHTSSNFLPTLKQVLQNLTRYEWVIRVEDQPGKGSLQDQNQALERDKHNHIVSHPTMEAIQIAFPESTVKIISS